MQNCIVVFMISINIMAWTSGWGQSHADILQLISELSPVNCVVGKYAYVAVESKGLFIYDIEDPRSPQLITQFMPKATFTEILINGTTGVLIDRDHLYNVDFSNPSNPFTIDDSSTSHVGSTDHDIEATVVEPRTIATVITIPDDYTTIQAGIDNAVEGDTVFVRSGRYAPSTNGEEYPIRIENRTGITLQGEGYATTILDAEQSGYDGTMLRMSSSRQIGLSDVTIQNGLYAGVLIEYSQKVTISHCNIIRQRAFAIDVFRCDSVQVIHNIAHADSFVHSSGIVADNSTHTLITHNTISGYQNESTFGGVDGIFISTTTDSYISSAEVCYNLIFNNRAGISIRKTDARVYHNTVISNIPVYPFIGTGRGIHIFRIQPPDQYLLWNNIVADHLNDGISVQYASLFELDYNDVWNNAQSYGENYWGTDPGEHDIQEDPIFDENYRLTIASPCIDAADPTFPWDPDNTPPDMGAFYFDQTIINVEPELTQIQIPISYSLAQNYPNPFNATTVFKYELPHKTHVVLTVYDVKGALVKTLVNTPNEAGTYTVLWNGKDEQNQDLTSGIYFYRLEADGFDIAKQMVLLR